MGEFQLLEFKKNNTMDTHTLITPNHNNNNSNSLYIYKQCMDIDQFVTFK